MQLEVREPMDILFCDLCNESVPEGDLRDGRAVRRKDRVICASCEAAMSAQIERGRAELAAAAAAAPLAGGANPVLVSHAPHPHSHSHVAAASKRSSGLGVALVAFIASIGFPLFLWTIIEAERLSATMSIADLQGDLSQLRNESSRLRAGLERESGELERRMRQEAADARRAVGTEVAELRRRFDESVASAGSLEGRLVALESRVGEADTANGERLDELAAQLARGRQDVNFFGERLAALEEAVQGGALLAGAAQAPSAEAPAAPAWSPALADLSSENPGTRWNAVQSLGESADPAVVPHLTPLLRDPDVFVRMAVARVLGDLAAPQAIEPLIDTLEDEDAAVREMAMVSLRAITSRDFKFDAVANPAERAKKVKAWRQWWEKAKEEYFPSVPPQNP